MAAKYILAVLAVVFLVAALMRVSPGGGISHPQTKTWLIIGIIFVVMSTWLFYRS
jgi:2-keto-3-deoxy-6-phosphogluconate aldolase